MTDFSKHPLDNFRNFWIAERKRAWGFEDLPTNNSYRDFWNTVDAITTAGLQYAMKLEPSSTDRNNLTSIFSVGFNIVIDIKNSVHFSVKPNRQIEILDSSSFWQHIFVPELIIKSGEFPIFDRMSIELLIRRYLELPYRSDVVTKILIDMLIAMELLQFHDEIRFIPKINIYFKFGLIGFFASTISLFYNQISLNTMNYFGKYSPVVEYLISEFNYYSPLLLLTSLAFLSLSIYVKFKIEIQKYRMMTAYRILATDGPIGVSKMVEQLQRAERSGVVWSPAIFALLEDAASRKAWI